MVLDWPQRSDIVAFVRFANAYDQTQHLSSIHFVHAIDLAVRGRNCYGSANDLVAYAEGEPLPPPDMRRLYAGFKKGRPQKGAVK